MIASALGVAYFMKAAYASATPEEFFWPFFVLFIVLFTATGLNSENQDAIMAELFKGWISLVKELPSDSGLETMPELSFKTDDT